jgi:hypothetical protein
MKLKSMVFAILLALLTSVLPTMGEAATEDTIETDEEALFGESTGAEEENTEDSSGGLLVEELEPPEEDIASILLSSEGVELGGRFGFSASGTWNWDDSSRLFKDFAAADRSSLGVNLGATIFIDGRPTEDTRVFGKMSTSYPFNGAGGTRDFDEVFHVEELFSDFNWREIVFFRGGKQTLNWGVGFFFSPADLLNITEIDPEDPEGELEGPVSLRAHAPVDIHNLYLYLIADDIATPDEIGLAGKAEFLLGPVEIGIGGLYQRDFAPAAMITVSSYLGDMDYFAEAVLRYGSDRSFLQESATAPLGLEVVTRDDSFFPSATAGFLFSRFFESNDSTLTLIAQYFFNGEGYSDPAIISENQAAVLALLGSGEIGFADLKDTGQHYAAAQMSYAWGSVATARAFWMHNYSDASGLFRPALSLDLFDGLAIELGASYNYGEAGGEFSPGGSSIAAEVGLSMGGSRF